MKRARASRTYPAGAFALAALFLALGGLDARAASNLTFVSVSGTDNADCTRAAPCRTLNAALAATNAEGEVQIMDSGSLEGAAITQSVSIVAPSGVDAVISALGGSGITINAASGIVTIKGITVTNVGIATAGITVTSAAQLELEDVTITGFSRRGSRGLSVVATGPTNVTVLRGRFRNDRTALYFQGAVNAPVTAVVRDSVMTGGSIGLDVRQDASVVAQDSTISGTDSVGANVEPTLTGRTARLSLVRTTISHIDGTALYVGDDAGISIANVSGSRLEFNVTGLRAGLRSTTRLVASAIADNIVGIDNDPSALVESAGNNVIRGNQNNGDDPVMFEPR